jgi:hypothetical protein
MKLMRPKKRRRDRNAREHFRRRSGLLCRLRVEPLEERRMLDGSSLFGPRQVLVKTETADGAMSVFATDLDGDGDADVLSASSADAKIAWYENLGGGAFGSQQVITTEAHGAWCVYATDLDGDGDADVLSASSNDDKIAWYENLGGGAFGSQQVLTTEADGASSVFATDLDGDGDADVLSASTLRRQDRLVRESRRRRLRQPAGHHHPGRRGLFRIRHGPGRRRGRRCALRLPDRRQDRLVRESRRRRLRQPAGPHHRGRHGATVCSPPTWTATGTPMCSPPPRTTNKIAWYENLGGGAFGSQQVITTAGPRGLERVRHGPGRRRGRRCALRL